MKNRFSQKDNNLFLEISGGLGNQLFQLAALKFFTNKHNLRPVIDLSRISTGKMSREFSIPVALCNILGLEEPSNKPKRPIALIRKKVLWNLESRAPNLRFRDLYYGNGVGFDPGPDANFNFNGISGYFQSFRYPDELGWHDKLKIFEPSNSVYQTLLSEMRQTKPIALHIRGGDYLADNSGIGNLSSSYYSKALHALGGGGQQIWVFTDDIEHAHKIVAPLKISFKIVDELNKLSAIETLYLISAAKKIIVSNSTFAWWAAYMSSKSEIYVPNKWFQAKDEPLDLIPSNWFRLESAWLT